MALEPCMLSFHYSLFIHFSEKPIYNITDIAIVNVSVAYFYKLIGNGLRRKKNAAGIVLIL